MLLQIRVTTSTALSQLRSLGLIPAGLPDNDDLVRVILLENYDPITSEDGTFGGWVEHVVPFVPTPGEVAIRECYAEIRNSPIKRNHALKLIRACWKQMNISLDYKTMFEQSDTAWKNKLIYTLFKRNTDGEFEALPNFPLRFKTDLLAIPYKVVIPA